MVFSGLKHSSARCIAPSNPRNMTAGVTKPVKNVTPSGQPALFSKLFQTKDDGCLSARTKHVTDIVRKAKRLRKTALVSQLVSATEY